MDLADRRHAEHVPGHVPAEASPIVLIPAFGPDDHSRGGAQARVTLVEYGDYECPQCANAHPVIEELQRNFGDDLRFVFRHFPITSAHPHAQRAAEAAEWAASQGHFWTMHDRLYQHKAKLSEGLILEIAGDLGLSSASLSDAWKSHSFFQRVKDDFLSGLRSEVAGTPTFFIQSQRHDGAGDRETLALAIATAASAVTTALAEPAPPVEVET
jgi:protein-disulfide isomerase